MSQDLGRVVGIGHHHPQPGARRAPPPLEFHEPDRVVAVWPERWFPKELFHRLQTPFDAVAAWGESRLTAAGGCESSEPLPLAASSARARPEDPSFNSIDLIAGSWAGLFHLGQLTRPPVPLEDVLHRKLQHLQVFIADELCKMFLYPAMH